jgi:hypothetical protein
LKESNKVNNDPRKKIELTIRKLYQLGKYFKMNGCLPSCRQAGING